MTKLESPHQAAGATASLILDAFAALEEKVGIEGRLVALDPAAPPPGRADAVIDLVHENTAIRYLVECKFTVGRKAQIDQLCQKLSSNNSPIRLRYEPSFKAAASALQIRLGGRVQIWIAPAARGARKWRQ